MSDGEWTEQSVADIYVALGTLSFRTIADSHNAALAAERQRYDKAMDTAMSELEKQLAAERHEQGMIRQNLGKQIEQLSDQLAAERKAREQTLRNLENAAIVIGDLNRQLAVEQDTLKKILQVTDLNMIHSLAKDALKLWTQTIG